MDKNEPKMFSEENDMIPGNPPDWAQDLTQIEEMLCSPILCMMSIFTLKGGQYGYSGNIINFPQDVIQIAESLPRTPSSLPIILVQSPNLNSKSSHFKVRRAKVLQFLSNCVETGVPGFENIYINQDIIELLPEDDYVDNCFQVIESKEIQNCFNENHNYHQLNEEEKKEQEEDNKYQECIIPLQLNQDREDVILSKEFEDTNTNRNTNTNTNPTNSNIIQWPSRDNIPINEFQCEYLATKCFPTLFANKGKGDPTNSCRLINVSYTLSFRHLLKYAGMCFFFILEAIVCNLNLNYN